MLSMVIRNISLAAIFLFVNSFNYGQNIDSLKNVLQTAHGGQRCDILFQLASAQVYVDNENSLNYASQGYHLALILGDTVRIVKGGRYLGQAYRRVDSLKASIKVFREALLFAAGKHSNKLIFTEYKNILTGIAITYLFQANYAKALDYNFKCVTILEAEGDNAQLSYLHTNIGLVYYKLFNYEKALLFYAKALHCKKESKFNSDLDRLLVNMGLCYYQLKEYNKAKAKFDEAYRACSGECSDPIKIEMEFGLGNTLTEMGDFSGALKHLNQSYKLSVETGNRRFQAENLVSLSDVYIQQKHNQLAIELLLKAEKITKDAGYLDILRTVYELLSDVHQQFPDYERMSYYQAQLITVKDSVFSRQIAARLTQLEAEYLEKENRASIALQNQILFLKEETIQRQQWINILVGCVALMLLILTSILLRRNRTKQKLNILLDQRVKERTRELEESHQTILRTTQERETLIDRTSEDMKSSLATIKGLCAVSLHDILDPQARQYLIKVEHTSNNLESALKNLETVQSFKLTS
jgi:tetratricopeptide (TPR) repeat protein